LTFGQLKPRLINILMSALQIETDSQNTHMLLGGLLLCVQDSVAFEDSESVSDLNSTSAKETNLLSSGEFICFAFVRRRKKCFKKWEIFKFIHIQNSFLICLMMPFIIFIYRILSNIPSHFMT
jgi:hypothetical protein